MSVTGSVFDSQDTTWIQAIQHKETFLSQARRVFSLPTKLPGWIFFYKVVNISVTSYESYWYAIIQAKVSKPFSDQEFFKKTVRQRQIASW